jgi:hypothetical protein
MDTKTIILLLVLAYYLGVSWWVYMNTVDDWLSRVKNALSWPLRMFG